MSSNIKAQTITIFKEIAIHCRVNILLSVFSNCFAGWLLSGGGNYLKFILAVASLLFLSTSSSMILALFDETSGRISLVGKKFTERDSVVLCSLMGCLSVFLAFLLDKLIGSMSVIVLLSALFMGIGQRKYLLSSLIPAVWRLFYYAVGGCVAANGLVGATMWGGVGMLFFMLGACIVCDPKWGNVKSLGVSVILFLCPLALAVIINDGDFQYRFQVICFCLLAVAWLYYNLKEEFKDGAITQRLVATICLFDLIAAGQESLGIAIIFLILFALTYVLGKLKFANFNSPLV